ncbi:MAG: tRNA lysidine(34) synthetase TilS [Lachnospiraceae bacterium]|nr:tRNA lysidine(34) synthetase TilS [Lachnospiraceae bacterium]
MDKDITLYIKENDMLKAGDCIIAAVSGGADSMCMLFCLTELSRELNFDIHVLHVNHGIRGAEADSDEAFVADHCFKNNIPFSSVHADVPSIAVKEGKTLEEAGREIRYDALFKAAREHGAAAVALAHNLNDRAETVLLNLLRGSGITGSIGIRPVTYRKGIKLIRPLLSTPRSRIEEILSEAKISYRTDSTNLSDEHTRNRLRSNIFPLLTAQINPRSVQHICSFAGDMSEASDFIFDHSEKVLQEALDSGEVTCRSSRTTDISVEFLDRLHPAIKSGVIRILISKLTNSLKDISRTNIGSILDLTDAETSKTVSLPYGLFALKARDRIVLGVKDELSKRPPAGDFFICKNYGSKDLSFVQTLIQQDALSGASNKNCTKWFNYDNICGNLQFRYPEKGDRISVLIGGELHRKEVAKVFREAGITAVEASGYPIVACGSDVLWIPRIRRCDDCLIDADTKKIIEITCISGDHGINRRNL